MISMIAAVANNGVIGMDNNLPWRIKEDLAFFKRMTKNKTVIMGRKTFESIGKPLAGRKNVVLTSTANIKDTEVVNNFTQTLEIAKLDNAFIIGGAKIYELFLPYTDVLYITEVNLNVAGDTLFPEFKHLFDCIEIWPKNDKDSNIDYRFTKWIRR
ncbi:MAG: diacylglycerol kinase [Candidatus Epulonipiscioides saccharophilum]|nr:MAG: diacylglycerol kinase [Epulopiscium sp. AS2M-Bin001]